MERIVQPFHDALATGTLAHLSLPLVGLCPGAELGFLPVVTCRFRTLASKRARERECRLRIGGQS